LPDHVTFGGVRLVPGVWLVPHRLRADRGAPFPEAVVKLTAVAEVLAAPGLFVPWAR
jgi:hypothetical protein